MYRYSEEDREEIVAARKRNKDKLAEKRLYALHIGKTVIFVIVYPMMVVHHTGICRQ